MSTSTWAGLACVLLLASGCGDQSAVAQDPAADAEVLVTCGGETSWPPSTMARGIPDVLTEEEATAAFRSIVEDPRTGGEASMSLFRDGVDVEWRVLAEADGGALTIGLGEWDERGPAETDAYVLGLEREGDGWSADGWGDCQLAPVLDDESAWARVEGYRVAGARSLEVDVTELQCASGREADQYLLDPTVVETAESVTLIWTTTPVEGAHTCQGNPPTGRIVELENAFGSRTVLDGSVYPPRRVPGGGGAH